MARAASRMWPNRKKKPQLWEKRERGETGGDDG